MLPYVVLKGSGVAIGRGKEALWAVGGAGSAAGTPRSVLANGCDRNLTEVLKRNLGFVEVADGRVSRLHCIISLGCDADGAQQAMLEDCSSNGTFLNHEKLAKGKSGEQQLSSLSGVGSRAAAGVEAGVQAVGLVVDAATARVAVPWL
jgi:hypothetical protein